MSLGQIIGGLIILAFFGIVIAAVAQIDGWKSSLLIFAGSLAVTAVIVLAVMLLTGAITL